MIAYAGWRRILRDGADRLDVEAAAQLPLESGSRS
jgi:hypothetical protein